jgi:hypothetical protein
MSDYEYRPLQGGNNLRVLHLRPAPELDAELECDLEEVSLETKPFYVALSYTWGSIDRNKLVSSNGQRLYITRNGEMAMRYLRRPDKPIPIWIDALCINQSSIAERNHQVALMADIYRTARRVIIWLGEGDNTYLGRNVVTHERLFRVMRQIKCLPSPFVSVGVFTRLVTATPDPRGELRMSIRIAMMSLCENAWMSRIWTVQELVLAKDPVIQYGREQIPWRAFRKIMMPDFGILTTASPSARIAARERLSVAVKVGWTDRTTYQEALIAIGQSMRATDLRDLVFAMLPFWQQLLPHGSSAPSLANMVNYDKPYFEIFRDFSEYLLVHHGWSALFRALYYSYHYPPTLSWVATWGEDEFNDGKPGVPMEESRRKGREVLELCLGLQASPPTVARIPIFGSDFLSINGQFLDRVIYVSSEMPHVKSMSVTSRRLPRWSAFWHDFEVDLREVVRARDDIDLSTLEKSLASLMHLLENQLREARLDKSIYKRLPKPRPFEQHVSAYRERNGKHKSGPDFSSKATASDSVDIPLGPLALNMLEKTPHELSTGLDNVRFFVTKDLDIGYCQAFAQEGDILAMLAGCPAPVILKEAPESGKYLLVSPAYFGICAGGRAWMSYQCRLLESGSAGGIREIKIPTVPFEWSLTRKKGRGPLYI